MIGGCEFFNIKLLAVLNNNHVLIDLANMLQLCVIKKQGMMYNVEMLLD